MPDRPTASLAESMSMNQPVVIIGVGEIGGVFARGLLRCNCPVYPVTRSQGLRKAADSFPAAQAVLVAVAENDIHNVLEDMPKAWRRKLILVQNELLPRDWEGYSIQDPTLVSIWFEKKRGQDPKVIIPSPVFGPHAALVHQALGALDIPSFTAPDANSMLFELVRKNLYILTSNIAGLVVGGTTGELWHKHRGLALQVAGDIMKLQTKLTGVELPWEPLIHAMAEAFLADPQHKCTGRSAPARLIRALAQAQQFQLDLPNLRGIHEVPYGLPIASKPDIPT